jgi:hypothetical protein
MSKQKRFSIESDILRVHDARVIVSAEFCKGNVRETNMYCSLKNKIWWATDKILNWFILKHIVIFIIREGSPYFVWGNLKFFNCIVSIQLYTHKFSSHLVVRNHLEFLGISMVNAIVLGPCCTKCLCK